MTTTSYTDSDEALSATWMHFLSLCNRIYDHYNLKTKYEKCAQLFWKHPLLSVCVLVTMVMCSMPVTVFVGFVIGSALFTFLGFLFVEGTVIMIGSVFLVGMLGAALVLGVMASVGLMMAWLACNAAAHVADFAKAKFLDCSNVKWSGLETHVKDMFSGEHKYYDNKEE